MRKRIRRLSIRLLASLARPRRRMRQLQLAGILAIVSQATLAQPLDSATLLLDNVRLVVGDGVVLEQAAVLIGEGRIISAGRREDIERVDGAEIIDLSGKTVMPALIDAHAHLGYEAQTSWGAQNYSRENLIDHLQRYAYYGFSAVFSAGSDPDALAFEVQQAQLYDEFIGARFLFAAGMAPPGQGPNDQFLSHALAVESREGQRILYGVADPIQAIESVREIAARNIPVIKIWVDDRGGSQQKLAPELYRVIAREANANGIEVYAHQQYATDMPELIDAGIAGFLHGRIGADLDQAIAQQLASAGVFLVPNLGLGELRREAIGADSFLTVTLPDSVAQRVGRSAQRVANPERDAARESVLRESFAHLLAAEVDIVLGTDAGAVPDHFFGYTGHRELEIFVRLGMTPAQALIAGTSAAARRLGLSDLGLLKAGYSADLIVLDENPLEDIRNTRSIAAVYLKGRLLDRDALAASFVD